MNLHTAEAFLRNYENTQARLSEVYDDDDQLRDALGVLFPEFEYPDFSHRTIGEIERRYFASPRPI